MTHIDAKRACKLAGVENATLNTIINNGWYTLAPETTQGTHRLFNEADFIKLWLFAGFVRKGVKYRSAEKLVTPIIDVLKIDPNVSSVSLSPEPWMTETYFIDTAGSLFREEIGRYVRDKLGSENHPNTDAS